MEGEDAEETFEWGHALSDGGTPVAEMECEREEDGDYERFDSGADEPCRVVCGEIVVCLCHSGEGDIE